MSESGQSPPNWAARAMSGFPPLATELRTSLVVRFVPFPEFGAVLNDFRFGKWKWQENNDRMYRNSTRMAVSRSRPLAAC